MADWFETLDDGIWLPPDESGGDEALFMKKVLCLRKGHTVLDAPCGAGRIAFHLAQAGCIVTGVDLRRQFVERARNRFRRARLRGTFRVMDLRSIDFVDEFHAIINWFASFGYFSAVDDVEILRRYTRALRKGGHLLIDQPNRERILRNFIPERVDGTIVTHSTWHEDAQRLVCCRTIGGVDDPKNTSSMRFYTPGQIKGLFTRVGMVVEEIYGSSEGDPFSSRSSRRMIVVGRKS